MILNVFGCTHNMSTNCHCPAFREVFITLIYIQFNNYPLSNKLISDRIFCCGGQRLYLLINWLLAFSTLVVKLFIYQVDIFIKGFFSVSVEVVDGSVHLF